MRSSSATSASRGTFSRTNVCSVSRLAIISGSVAFFAPEIGIVPLRLRPPMMRMRSMLIPQLNFKVRCGPKSPQNYGTSVNRTCVLVGSLNVVPPNNADSAANVSYSYWLFALALLAALIAAEVGCASFGLGLLLVFRRGFGDRPVRRLGALSRLVLAPLEVLAQRGGETRFARGTGIGFAAFTGRGHGCTQSMSARGRQCRSLAPTGPVMAKDRRAISSVLRPAPAAVAQW